MKRITFFISLVAVILLGLSCTGKGNKKEVSTAISAQGINVYYFHFTRRCATCMAVEENNRKAFEALYQNEIKAGEYSFSSLNLDEESTKEIADKLGVGGQSMLVVRGDKKLDITAAVWMSAHDIEKMKEEIRSGVEKVMY